jgi:hypothetical protein
MRHGKKDQWGNYYPRTKEHRPTFWVVIAVADRCYGGPEEGGWWWDYRENLIEPYRFPKITKKVHRYLAAKRRAFGQDTRLHHQGEDWPNLSSVLAAADTWAGIVNWRPSERTDSGGYC